MGITIQKRKKFKVKFAKPKKKVGKAPGASKYSDAIVFKVYELARSGLSDRKIQEYLQISIQGMIDWKRKYPLFQMALDEGRKHVNGQDGQLTFREYVYKRLAPDLKKLWDEINACEREHNGVLRMEALFRQHGVQARQHLFLYALTASNFNASTACKKVGVTKETVDNWTEKDPRFARLMDEIHWHKGNFFESALVGAVKAGETGAILFANRTFNKDRGYGMKVEHEIKGTVNHLHVTVDFERLQGKLSIEARRELLDAIKADEDNTPKMLGYEPQGADIIDAEFEEKEAG
jgi:hypothetical protein